MRKIFLILVLIFGTTGLARAQQKQVLSVAGATCTATGTTCLINGVDPGIGGMTFTVSANASANTLQFEASGDGATTWVALNVTPSNSSTAVTSTTSTGTWQANVAGYTNVRIRMSTLAGGTSTVSIISSFASARSSGGGGGTVTSVSGTAPIVSSGGNTPAISCATCTTGTVGLRQIAFGTGSGNGIQGDSVLIYNTGTHQFQFTPPNIGTGSVAFQLNETGTGAASNDVGGLFITTPTSVVSAGGTFEALAGSAQPTGSGNFTAGVTGVRGQLLNSSSGTLSNAYSLRALVPSNTGGGTITNMYGFYSDNMGGLGGTLTAAFKAAAQTAGANNFGFHSDVTNKDHFGLLSAVTFSSDTNCTSSASPAVCGSAAAGTVVVAAGATTVVVNTTGVTANSEIFVQFDSSLGTKLGVTCNTTVDLGQVTARTAATSFTITAASAPSVNPACYSYFLVN